MSGRPKCTSTISCLHFPDIKGKEPSSHARSTASNFGKVLTALHIERKHTRYGNLLSSSAAHPSHVSQDLAVAQANAASETYVIEIIPSTLNLLSSSSSVSMEIIVFPSGVRFESGQENRGGDQMIHLFRG